MSKTSKRHLCLYFSFSIRQTKKCGISVFKNNFISKIIRSRFSILSERKNWFKLQLFCDCSHKIIPFIIFLFSRNDLFICSAAICVKESEKNFYKIIALVGLHWLLFTHLFLAGASSLSVSLCQYHFTQRGAVLRQRKMNWIIFVLSIVTNSNFVFVYSPV